MNSKNFLKLSLLILLLAGLTAAHGEEKGWAESLVEVSINNLYINTNSLTGGPVHWHAQFEIWICGEKVELVNPTGLSNKVGTEMLHEHNDDFIHIEGVVHDFEDINLHAFFEAAGGEFMKDSLMIPTNEGSVEVKNGDTCPNGQP